MLLELEEKDAQVAASFWLAAEYGDEVDRTDQALTEWRSRYPAARAAGMKLSISCGLGEPGSAVMSGTGAMSIIGCHQWAETEAEHGAITGDEGN